MGCADGNCFVHGDVVGTVQITEFVCVPAENMLKLLNNKYIIVPEQLFNGYINLTCAPTSGSMHASAIFAVSFQLMGFARLTDFHVLLSVQSDMSTASDSTSSSSYSLITVNLQFNNS